VAFEAYRGDLVSMEDSPGRASGIARAGRGQVRSRPSLSRSGQVTSVSVEVRSGHVRL